MVFKKAMMAIRLCRRSMSRNRNIYCRKDCKHSSVTLYMLFIEWEERYEIDRSFLRHPGMIRSKLSNTASCLFSCHGSDFSGIDLFELKINFWGGKTELSEPWKFWSRPRGGRPVIQESESTTASNYCTKHQRQTKPRYWPCMRVAGPIRPRSIWGRTIVKYWELEILEGQKSFICMKVAHRVKKSIDPHYSISSLIFAASRILNTHRAGTYPVGQSRDSRRAILYTGYFLLATRDQPVNGRNM